MLNDDIEEMLTDHEKWVRKESGGRRAKLTGHSFAGENLRGREFAGIDIKCCGFEYSDLKDINFKRATLINCKFEHANMQEANFREADLTGSSLDYVNVKWADFNEAKLPDGKFLSVKVTNAYPIITVTGFLYSILVFDEHAIINKRTKLIDDWLKLMRGERGKKEYLGSDIENVICNEETQFYIDQLVLIKKWREIYKNETENERKRLIG